MTLYRSKQHTAKKISTKKIAKLSLLTAYACLSSCGGNGGGTSSNLDDQSDSTVQARYTLSPTSKDAFEAYIKQAFENSNQSTPTYIDDTSNINTGVAISIMNDAIQTLADSPASASSAESASSTESASSDDTFSTTYLQEAGVDEADLMKFDGEYLYIAHRPQYYYWAEPLLTDAITLAPPVAEIDISTSTATSARMSLAPKTSERAPASIRVMQLSDAPAKADEVTTLTIEQPTLDSSKVSQNSVNIEGLYLYQDRLTVLTGHARYDQWDDYRYWSAGAVGLQTYNTQNPTTITPEEQATIEGAYLIGSRRIGNALYIVTRTTPYLRNFTWYPSTESQIDANQALIDQLSLDQLLPTLKRDDGTTETLVSAEQCFLPSNLDRENDRSPYYTPEIITIVRISLDDFSDRDALCTTAPTQGIYMSQDALYLFGSQPLYRFNQEPITAVHKFGLETQSPDYRGSGSLPGYLGWNNPAYRLGERDGALIAVTSDATTDDAIPNDTGHRLTVLKESVASDALEQVAQLPNPDQPAVIGKPNESIYGVRIMGERAYVVTFQRTDPLYVFNITDPEAPFIAGELELPGFSELLHPINNDRLLGIGYDADENGLTQGLKASLFDVSQITAPSVISSITLGDRYTRSPATNNFKAFSIVTSSSDEHRFTLPLSLYEYDNEERHLSWQYTGLALFSIQDLNNNAPSLTHHGAIKRAETEEGDTSAQLNAVERGILLNDSVHYLSGKQLWSATWDSPEQPTGPQ